MALGEGACKLKAHHALATFNSGLALPLNEALTVCSHPHAGCTPIYKHVRIPSANIPTSHVLLQQVFENESIFCSLLWKPNIKTDFLLFTIYYLSSTELGMDSVEQCRMLHFLIVIIHSSPYPNILGAFPDLIVFEKLM